MSRISLQSAPPAPAPPDEGPSREAGPPECGRDRAVAQELIMHLEPDQLVAETFRPVAPAVLGRNALIGLWALRVFAVVLSLMVTYTFIAGLH